MDSCPSCKGQQTVVISHISVVGGEQLRFEFICISCGIAFTDYTTPGKEKENHLVRIRFESAKKPKGKEAIRAVKQKDLALYREWAAVLVHYHNIAYDQLENREFSDFACHFLYVARRLLHWLLCLLDHRIKQLDLWLQSPQDKEP